MKLKRLLIIGMLSLLVLGLVIDFSRHRCRRISVALLAIAVKPVSRTASDALLRVSDPQSLFVYSVPDWDPDDPRNKRYSRKIGGVQSGEMVFAHTQRIVFLKPPWYGVPQSEYLDEFETQNPDAIPIVPGSTPCPDFILLQTGDGVGGLDMQVVLNHMGNVTVTRFPYWSNDVESPVSWQRELDDHHTSYAFWLAKNAFVGETSEVTWHCGVLDGNVTSIIFFRAGVASRQHFVNGERPSCNYCELAGFLAGLGASESVKIIQTKKMDESLTNKG